MTEAIIEYTLLWPLIAYVIIAFLTLLGLLFGERLGLPLYILLPLIGIEIRIMLIGCILWILTLYVLSWFPQLLTES